MEKSIGWSLNYFEEYTNVLVYIITVTVKQNALLQEFAKTVPHNFYLFSIDSIGNNMRSQRLGHGHYC